MEQTWKQQQNKLKLLLKKNNPPGWNLKDIKIIAGTDISFIKNTDTACACVVFLSYPELNVIEEKFEIVKMNEPYIAGFLAFREVKPLMKLYNSSKNKADVILVDGNGILHPRGFGLASHLGVLLDVPTIGVGKTLFHVDNLNSKQVKKELTQSGKRELVLKGSSGEIWGLAYLPTTDTTNPIFISIGYNINLETAFDIVKRVCKYRIPEPVRCADIASREFLRQQKQTI